MTQTRESNEGRLVEAMFSIYYLLGGETEGCTSGASFLAITGLGGHSLDGFIGTINAHARDIAEELNEDCYDCKKDRMVGP